MKGLWISATVLAVLAGVYIHFGHPMRQMFLGSPLPEGFFYGSSLTTSCKIVRDPVMNRLRSCEDASLWHTGSGAKAVFSCDPGRHEWNTVMGPLADPDPQGDIWIYDFLSIGDQPRRVRIEGLPRGSDFHPLGAHIYSDTAGDSAPQLFIVNHQRSRSTVEQFELTTSEHPYIAKHVRTWSHPAMVAPNAIVPLSPTSFYVSNDHRYPRRIFGALAQVETILGLPLGWVDRFDLVNGEINVTRIASSIPFANGIAVSPSGEELAVASSSTSKILLYDLDVSTGTVIFKESLYTPFSPDNLSYDKDDGSLLVAGHPHFLSLIKYSRKQATKAPSWAIEFSKTNKTVIDPVDDSQPPFSAYERTDPSSTHSIRTIYQSDGSHYSSSTSLIRHGNHVFVSGLYEVGILHCSL